MKVTLEIDISVDHLKDGTAHSCPELVAERVKEDLDKAFEATWTRRQYMMATSVKIKDVTDFNKELEQQKGAFISKYFGTENRK